MLPIIITTVITNITIVSTYAVYLPGSRQRLNLSHQPERSHSAQVFPHQGNNLAHQSLGNLEDL